MINKNLNSSKENNFTLDPVKIFLVNRHMPYGYKLETLSNLKRKFQKWDGIPLGSELVLKRQKIDSVSNLNF